MKNSTYVGLESLLEVVVKAFAWVNSGMAKSFGALKFVVLLAVAAAAGCGGTDTPATVGEAKATAKPSGTAIDSYRAQKLRDDALARARVWHPPPVPIGDVDLRSNARDAGSFRDDQEVECRFRTDRIGGLTPKFYCELPGQDVVKVKYGSTNAELRAEVAATRLLETLGFAADRVYVVRNVRCAGCPLFPFTSLKCLQRTGVKAACFPAGIDYNSVNDFEAAVIERKLSGRTIEGHADQGWAWYELDKIDPSRGGSPPAEVDALRLMAVLLAHWDNKSENQRLICAPGGDAPDGTCSTPIALAQDLGATFGPAKVDLNNWRHYRVWADGATCTVSMKSLPFQGATFPDRRISEAGRTFLLTLLEQLSDEQLRDLFEGSLITHHEQFAAEARNPDSWVRAFKDKVQQIRDAGPCPTASE